MNEKPAPKRGPKPDNPEQSKRFFETAEEVEADKDPASFERAFGRIATKTRSPTRGGRHTKLKLNGVAK